MVLFQKKSQETNFKKLLNLGMQKKLEKGSNLGPLGCKEGF
jgi:hypothetical protein